MKQLILDVRPDFRPSFENFVPGDNAALVAALREHLEREDGSVLYLWGPPSSGRSHLLEAACTEAATTRPVCRHPDIASARSLYCIDDIDAQAEESLAKLFRALINARALHQAFVISGPCPPSALALRVDVASRIAQGLAFEMRPLTDEQKKAALLQHANDRGMQLSTEIVDYLLRHGRRDLPWLMAVLDALDETTLTLARPITLPLLRDILAPSL